VIVAYVSTGARDIAAGCEEESVPPRNTVEASLAEPGLGSLNCEQVVVVGEARAEPLVAGSLEPVRL